MNKQPETNSLLIYNARQSCWWYFSSPVEIVQTARVEDVVDCLQQVEKHCANNRYAAGFLAYEAASAFDKSFLTYSPENNLPLLWFGIYDSPAIVPASAVEGEKVVVPRELQLDTSADDYQWSIERIKAFIAEGDTYQVNYTLRFQGILEDDPWQFFRGMSANAVYGAFLNLPAYYICSASPELFFTKNGRRLTARPMKGTAHRGFNREADLRAREQLLASEKERAENAMIVDMLRNDLGRIADVGSVQVTEAFVAEKYPTLWQMTSTVQAESDAGITEIFRALFPCASITGAPKIRTMELINDLETSARGVYTGNIGFVTPQGDAQFNVAIRTALVEKASNTLTYGAGSGIVWDSLAEKEYEECRLKSAAIRKPFQRSFSLLETLRWSSDGGYYLLQYHLQRMAESALFFDFAFDANAVLAELERLTETFTESLCRIRLLVASDGKILTETCSLENPEKEEMLAAAIAESPITSNDPFLYHKTTRREVYTRFLEANAGKADVLLWNENGELTEFCNGNLVVKINDKYFTPPVDCGLLNGCFRQYLLDKETVEESVLPLFVLKQAAEVYRINSVREWQKVALSYPI